METPMEVMAEQSHPVYDHDCSECQYLGSIKEHGQIYDCYFCNKGVSSYLGRFSSTGEDYISLPVFLADALGKFEPYKTIIGLHNLN